MKGCQIVLGQVFGCDVVVLMQDGVLVDLIIDFIGVMFIVFGVICCGKVDWLVKGQGGVFLKLFDGVKGYFWDCSGLCEGQVILVQISGVVEDGKVIFVLVWLNFCGCYIIVMLGMLGVNVLCWIWEIDICDELQGFGDVVVEGLLDVFGIVFCSVVVYVELDVIVDELNQFLDLCKVIFVDVDGVFELLLDVFEFVEVVWYDWVEFVFDVIEDGDDVFEYFGVFEVVEVLLLFCIELGGGVWVEMEVLWVLVVVDVNIGSNILFVVGLKVNIVLVCDLL